MNNNEEYKQLERKCEQLTESLRGCRAELERVQAMAHIGSWEWDLSKETVFWSDELYRVCGREPRGLNREILLGEIMDWIHPHDRAGFMAAASQAIESKSEEFNDESRIIRPDDSVCYLRWTGEVKFDDAGRPCRIVGAAQDITLIRAAEEDRMKLEVQVQQAQKMESLGILAGGIAHDFNNLLMAVLGNVDIALEDTPPGSPIRDCLTDIEGNARRASDLCKQMLAYSGRGQFRSINLDMSGLVQQMTNLLEASISKSATLAYDLHTGLPDFSGDPTQLRQVIMNLVTNASEAIGEHRGNIRIATGLRHCSAAFLSRTYLAEALPEGIYVYLEVTDSGCGMDGDTLKRIFDPFFTTKFIGRGLGLAAVLGIVRAHKGAIRIESQMEKGTTFKVFFPALETDEPQENPQAERGGDLKWKGEGLVLLADDEDSVRSVASRMFKRLGFGVVTAKNGREAVEVLKEHSDEVQYVVLDLTMPYMDGANTLQELRRVNPDVKVIISSGYSEDEVDKTFPSEDLAGFVQKPYTTKSLQLMFQSL